ncbi:MAG TPA: nitroreductase family protein [Gemmatimonadales bacterium]|nr:nitroreductase family protein [Gemmatimonadales bacterium]
MDQVTGRDQAVLETIYHRRAVRSFGPDRIDEQTIRTLLAAAVQAPTAMHLEPWTFVVIQDRAVLERYSNRAVAMVKPDAGLTRLVAAGGDIFHGAGTLIVICGKPLGAFVVADCWLAGENLMLAADALGLGTCCIGFAVPLLNAAEVKRELGIPADVTAVAPIIVGVPADIAPPVSRKPPDILRWVR